MDKEIAAIYCRLSQDDGSVGESGSIQTQELLCRGWSHHLIHMTAVHLWQNGTLQLYPYLTVICQKPSP